MEAVIIRSFAMLNLSNQSPPLSIRSWTSSARVFKSSIDSLIIASCQEPQNISSLYDSGKDKILASVILIRSDSFLTVKFLVVVAVKNGSFAGFGYPIIDKSEFTFKDLLSLVSKFAITGILDNNASIESPNICCKTSPCIIFGNSGINSCSIS